MSRQALPCAGQRRRPMDALGPGQGGPSQRPRLLSWEHWHLTLLGQSRPTQPPSLVFSRPREMFPTQAGRRRPCGCFPDVERGGPRGSPQHPAGREAPRCAGSPPEDEQGPPTPGSWPRRQEGQPAGTTPLPCGPGAASGPSGRCDSQPSRRSTRGRVQHPDKRPHVSEPENH